MSMPIALMIMHIIMMTFPHTPEMPRPSYNGNDTMAEINKKIPNITAPQPFCFDKFGFCCLRISAPQLGHVVQSSEISAPQSLHLINPIMHYFLSSSLNADSYLKYLSISSLYLARCFSAFSEALSIAFSLFSRYALSNAFASCRAYDSGEQAQDWLIIIDRTITEIMETNFFIIT